MEWISQSIICSMVSDISQTRKAGRTFTIFKRTFNPAALQGLSPWRRAMLTDLGLSTTLVVILAVLEGSLLLEMIVHPSGYSHSDITVLLIYENAIVRPI